MVVQLIIKKWGALALVLVVALSIGMTRPREVKRYSLPFDFYVGYDGRYAQTEGPFRVLRFSAKDGTVRCDTLAEGDEHYYRFYYDTTSSDPQVFVVYGDEEDPLSQYVKFDGCLFEEDCFREGITLSQYVKFDGFPLIEVASTWGDGTDYIYSFSDIDDGGIRYYYVTGYYHLDTATDTILNLPPHEDTLVSYYQWKDLIPEKFDCSN